jgi:hypothetical protein
MDSVGQLKLSANYSFPMPISKVAISIRSKMARKMQFKMRSQGIGEKDCNEKYTN